ncbi:MAG: M67 family metallopeptidase [Deltaproteobacteria bacterium]|nr:M67 family metallopeptidase [Deltaproteobacteria bacterium]
MLYLSKNIYNGIINHAKESYPYEGCGVLVGKQKQGSGVKGQGSGIVKNILRIYPLENINKDRANDRYEIDPRDLLRVEKEASKERLDVIGFFHSHPDHPDRPSEFDRQRAWPLYSYIIVSVRNGKDVSVKSWTFEDEGESFKEEEIRIDFRH